MKKILSTLFSVVVMLGVGIVANAEVNAITPSTNDINRTNEWAHVNQVSKTIGSTDLQFVSTRNFYSCFEYRTDGDTTQATSPTNYNPDVTDGLYPFYCLKNETKTVSIPADEYVEVRMVFGAESDERFDWTRFDVLQPVVPQTMDECKKGGWKTFTNPEFKNQGQCVSYVQANEHAGKRD